MRKGYYWASAERRDEMYIGLPPSRCQGGDRADAGPVTREEARQRAETFLAGQGLQVTGFRRLGQPDTPIGG